MIRVRRLATLSTILLSILVAVPNGHAIEVTTTIDVNRGNPSTGSGCSGDSPPVFTLFGGNMDADGSCNVGRTEADPGLADALSYRGGFAPVLALVPGAAAMDAGINSGCPATDRRGVARPVDGNADQLPTCDAGAFEALGATVFADGLESP